MKDRPDTSAPGRPAAPGPGGGAPATGRWTLLDHHAHVLVCLSRHPESRIRDLAERLGITPRAVQKILGDLERAGLLVRRREGRCNAYELQLDVPARHPLEDHWDVRELIEGPRAASRGRRAGRRS